MQRFRIQFLPSQKYASKKKKNIKQTHKQNTFLVFAASQAYFKSKIDVTYDKICTQGEKANGWVKVNSKADVSLHFLFQSERISGRTKKTEV